MRCGKWVRCYSYAYRILAEKKETVDLAGRSALLRNHWSRCGSLRSGAAQASGNFKRSSCGNIARRASSSFSVLKACRSLIASARCAPGASVELADLRPCEWLQMTCLALRSGLLCSSIFLAAASALGSAYGFLQG